MNQARLLLNFRRFFLNFLWPLWFKYNLVLRWGKNGADFYTYDVFACRDVGSGRLRHGEAGGIGCEGLGGQGD